MTSPPPNIINHIALVLDASLSMSRLADQLVKVADAEIAHLARRSRELDQETRVTVYTFNDPDKIECVIYDKDVLRLPSIAHHYRVGGRGTALVAATLQSQEDLKHTAQLYGDHAFLTYVLTDGEENVSHFAARFNDGAEIPWSSLCRTKCTPQQVTAYLTAELRALPDNWTVACLVPNQAGVHEAKKFGFPAGNIAVWDATSRAGVTEAVGTAIRTATESFMMGRSRGVRGSKTVFTAGVDTLNSETVKVAGLGALPPDRYRLLKVDADGPIREFIERETQATYRTGWAFYELTKPEKIQPQKEVCVRNRRSGRVYVGAARQLLGLPDHEVRVKPESNPLYQVFVQSTSVNRKLIAGTKVLLLTAAP